MDVSVVIPAHNAAWCVRTLVSNLEISCKGCEIIFIDDGSTDASGDLFSSLMPRAICIRQPHRGVGAARNHGVATATRKFVQLLDADDTLLPGKLEAQMEVAEAKAADVVYSDWRMLEFFENGKIEHPATEAGEPDDVTAALLEGWWFPTASALVRRSAYVAAGGCDEALENTCDDFHLWVQMAIAGAQFAYCPGVFSNYHRYHNRSSVSRRDPRSFLSGETTIIRNALVALSPDDPRTNTRKRAAAIRLHHVARNFYKFDKAMYASLMSEVRRIDPHFEPRGSKLYRRAWKSFGDNATEWLALRFAMIRRVKRRVLPWLSRTNLHFSRT
jgi:glycosyltransferase involved in cell wall biosynthesis